MNAEISALEDNHTWILVDLPAGKVPVRCKWVYKVKYHADNTIERYKATLVSKGYTQLEGVDYFDTFSPVAKITIVRLDVNNAFLHVDLNEEVYMHPPPGYGSYGNSLAEITQVNTFLDQKFRIKDLGQLKYFLGLEIARSTSGIFLNQRKYVLEFLEDTGFLGAKLVSTPIDPNTKLSSTNGIPLDDPSSYMKLIGRLLYLTNTRPGISYSVQHLSQFVSNPFIPHYQVATRVLRYLKAFPAQGVLFSSSSALKLHGFADSDGARCPDSRRSVTGFCVLLGDYLLSWRSKKQNTVSRSSTEAEYKALTSLTCEI
ncbi:uncharacterized mitochondrial protein AtMg00810-like [Vicia villosa]|uniref:uncharacterized mitochondrial protein AtMg00810-like n=1 Tax=Vicia villosa TaxID=3911 RepID=UPI00273B9DE4|nr:uncharacterized mitochondrial protein AtMg00810-like [Vicia villosa]